jgi:hypothetical protein
MQNKLKVLSVSKPQVYSTGLAPVIGYEPWVQRSIESAKQAINDGNPILIRVHSAADYPCQQFSVGYKLDMESHAVLIIGYDDDTRTFDIVDPWNEKWGGEYNGIRKLPYEVAPIVCVNATLDKHTDLALPDYKLIKYEDTEGNASLHIKIGFYEPKGYVMDRQDSAFTAIDIAATLPESLKSKHITQRLEGRWHIGEYAETMIPLGRELVGAYEIKLCFAITLEGERPYRYVDILSMEIIEQVVFESAREIDSKQVLAV